MATFFFFPNILNSKMEKSVGAIFFRREGARVKFLLLKYGKGYWDFVKGHVEAGESEWDTLKREAMEETGIGEFEIIPGFRERISCFFKKDGKTIYKEVIFFLAETKTKDVKLSFEHLDFAWLDLREAIGRADYKSAKDLLKKAGQCVKIQHFSK